MFRLDGLSGRSADFFEYKTEDTRAAILASGYFDGAADRFFPGDRIRVERVTGLGLNSEASLETFSARILRSSSSGVDLTDSFASASLGTLNVRDYPYLAQGDGVTDDTAAIQQAIDDAAADNGGTVLLPFGTYLISAQLDIKTGVTVQGLGGVTIQSASDINMVRIFDGGKLANVYLYNTVGGGRTDANAMVLFYADGTDRFNTYGTNSRTTLRDVVIEGGTNSLGAGIMLHAADADGGTENAAVLGVTVDNVAIGVVGDAIRFRNDENTGASKESYVNGNLFKNIYINQCKEGIVAQQPGTSTSAEMTQNIFSNVYVQWVTGQTSAIYSVGATDFQRNVITGLTVFDFDSDSGTNYMIQLADTGQNARDGNTIIGSFFASTADLAYAYSADWQANNRVTLNGNEYGGNNSYLEALVCTTTTATPYLTSHDIRSDGGGDQTINTITPFGPRGTILTLSCKVGAGSNVILADGVDNIELVGGGTFTVGFNDSIQLLWNGTDWVELCRAVV